MAESKTPCLAVLLLIMLVTALASLPSPSAAGTAISAVPSAPDVFSPDVLKYNISYTVTGPTDSVVAMGLPYLPYIVVMNYTGIYMLNMTPTYKYYVLGIYTNTTTNHDILVVGVESANKTTRGFLLIDTVTDRIIASYNFTTTDPIQPVPIIYISKNILYFDGLTIDVAPNGTILRTEYLNPDVVTDTADGTYKVIYNIPTLNGLVEVELSLQVNTLATSSGNIVATVVSPIYNLVVDSLSIITPSMNASLPLSALSWTATFSQYDYPCPFAVYIVNATYALYSQSMGPTIVVSNGKIFRGASMYGLAIAEHPLPAQYVVTQMYVRPYSIGWNQFIITNTTLYASLPGMLGEVSTTTGAAAMYPTLVRLLASPAKNPVSTAPPPNNALGTFIGAVEARIVGATAMTGKQVSLRSLGTLSFTVKTVNMQVIMVSTDYVEVDADVNISYSGTANDVTTAVYGFYQGQNNSTLSVTTCILFDTQTVIETAYQTQRVGYNISLTRTGDNFVFYDLHTMFVVPVVDAGCPVYLDLWYSYDNMSIEPLLVASMYAVDTGPLNMLGTANGYEEDLVIPPINATAKLLDDEGVAKTYSINITYTGSDGVIAGIYTNSTATPAKSVVYTVTSRVIASPRHVFPYIYKEFIPSPDGRIKPFISSTVLKHVGLTALPVYDEVPVIGFLDTKTGKVQQYTIDFSDKVIQGLSGDTGGIIVGVADNGTIYYGVVEIVFVDNYAEVHELFTAINLTSGKVLTSKMFAVPWARGSALAVTTLSPVPYAIGDMVGMGPVFYDTSTGEVVVLNPGASNAPYSITAIDASSLPRRTSTVASRVSGAVETKTSTVSSATGSEPAFIVALYSSNIRMTQIASITLTSTATGLQASSTSLYDVNGLWVIVGYRDGLLFLYNVNTTGTVIALNITSGDIVSTKYTAYLASGIPAITQVLVNPYSALALTREKPVLIGYPIPDTALDSFAGTTVVVGGANISVLGIAYQEALQAIIALFDMYPYEKYIVAGGELVVAPHLSSGEQVVVGNVSIYMPSLEKTTPWTPTVNPGLLQLSPVVASTSFTSINTVPYSGKPAIFTTEEPVKLSGVMSVDNSTGTTLVNITLTSQNSYVLIVYPPATAARQSSYAVIVTTKATTASLYNAPISYTISADMNSSVVIPAAVLLLNQTGTASSGEVQQTSGVLPKYSAAYIVYATDGMITPLSAICPSVVNTTYLFMASTLPIQSISYVNTSSWFNMTVDVPSGFYTSSFTGGLGLVLFTNKTAVGGVIADGALKKFVVTEDGIVFDPVLTISIKYGSPIVAGTGTVVQLSASSQATSTRAHIVMGGKALYDTSLYSVVVFAAVLAATLVCVLAVARMRR